MQTAKKAGRRDLIVLAVYVAAIVASAFAIHFYRHTVIGLGPTVGVAAVGALASLVVFRRWVYPKKYEGSVFMEVFVGVAFSCFLFLFLNRLFTGPTRSTELPIVTYGTSHPRRSCEHPYVEVNFDGVPYDVHLGCDMMPVYRNYNRVYFTYVTGAFGLPIIRSHVLR